MLGNTKEGKERVPLTKEEYDSLKRDKSQADIIVRAINRTAFRNWNLPEEMTLRLNSRGYLLLGGLGREAKINPRVIFQKTEVLDDGKSQWLFYSLVKEGEVLWRIDGLITDLLKTWEQESYFTKKDAPQWKGVEIKNGDYGNRPVIADAINKEGFDYLNLPDGLILRLTDEGNLMLKSGAGPEKDTGVRAGDGDLWGPMGHKMAYDPEGFYYHFQHTEGGDPISNADLKARLRSMGEKMGVKEHKVLDQTQSIEPGVASKGKE